MLVLRSDNPYLRSMSEIALSPSAAARVAAIAARQDKPAILRRYAEEQMRRSVIQSKTLRAA